MAEAIEHHRASEAAKMAGFHHRAKRDRLVHELRSSDPKKWTHLQLATELGCSEELVALILRKPAPADPGPVPD